MLNTLRLLFSMLNVAAFAFGAGFVTAQDFPNKPIRFIVPNTTGNTSDFMPRILGPAMAKFLGQPVVVENKPGAGSLIGYEYVAKQAPADGYTLLLGTPINLALYTVTVKPENLRFDPLKDLPPLMNLVESRLVLVSPSNAPWKGFNEMVAYAKANPGKLNFGSSGPQTVLQMEALRLALGINVVNVPFSNNQDFTKSLVAGDVHLGLRTLVDASAVGDRLQILAVTGDRRADQVPSIPTFRELGFPIMQGTIWGAYVRAGTPNAAMAKLHAAISQALQQPDVKAQIAKLGVEMTADLTPETAAKRIADEHKLYSGIAKTIDFKPE